MSRDSRQSETLRRLNVPRIPLGNDALKHLVAMLGRSSALEKGEMKKAELYEYLQKFQRTEADECLAKRGPFWGAVDYEQIGLNIEDIINTGNHLWKGQNIYRKTGDIISALSVLCTLWEDPQKKSGHELYNSLCRLRQRDWLVAKEMKRGQRPSSLTVASTPAARGAQREDEAEVVEDTEEPQHEPDEDEGNVEEEEEEEEEDHAADGYQEDEGEEVEAAPEDLAYEEDANETTEVSALPDGGAAQSEAAEVADGEITFTTVTGTEDTLSLRRRLSYHFANMDDSEVEKRAADMPESYLPAYYHVFLYMGPVAPLISEDLSIHPALAEAAARGTTTLAGEGTERGVVKGTSRRKHRANIAHDAAEERYKSDGRGVPSQHKEELAFAKDALRLQKQEHKLKLMEASARLEDSRMSRMLTVMQTLDANNPLRDRIKSAYDKAMLDAVMRDVQAIEDGSFGHPIVLESDEDAEVSVTMTTGPVIVDDNDADNPSPPKLARTSPDPGHLSQAESSSAASTPTSRRASSASDTSSKKSAPSSATTATTRGASATPPRTPSTKTATTSSPTTPGKQHSTAASTPAGSAKSAAAPGRAQGVTQTVALSSKSTAPGQAAQGKKPATPAVQGKQQEAQGKKPAEPAAQGKKPAAPAAQGKKPAAPAVQSKQQPAQGKQPAAPKRSARTT